MKYFLQEIGKRNGTQFTVEKKSTKMCEKLITSFLRVIEEFINTRVITNQQSTYKISHRIVEPFSNGLIHIFIKKAQFANLGKQFIFTIGQKLIFRNQ